MISLTVKEDVTYTGHVIKNNTINSMLLALTRNDIVKKHRAILIELVPNAQGTLNKVEVAQGTGKNYGGSYGVIYNFKPVKLLASKRYILELEAFCQI